MEPSTPAGESKGTLLSALPKGKAKGESHQSERCSPCRVSRTIEENEVRQHISRGCLDTSLKRNHGRRKGPGESKPKDTQSV